MAKTLKEENLRLNIIVNGDPARKEILQLTRNSRDLRAENERLRAEQKKLRTKGGANKTRIEEIEFRKKSEKYNNEFFEVLKEYANRQSYVTKLYIPEPVGCLGKIHKPVAQAQKDAAIPARMIFLPGFINRQGGSA